MDILGIGTEIVECLRIGRMIEQHGELFLTRVYTEREIVDCQNKRRAIEEFAARWAAKEAVFKAMGQPWHKDLPFTDIEIRQEKVVNPSVFLSGALRERATEQHIGSFLVSMSHCRAYAMAHALALRG